MPMLWNLASAPYPPCTLVSFSDISRTCEPQGPPVPDSVECASSGTREWSSKCALACTGVGQNLMNGRTIHWKGRDRRRATNPWHTAEERQSLRSLSLPWPLVSSSPCSAEQCLALCLQRTSVLQPWMLTSSTGLRRQRSSAGSSWA